jgi:hypothetical protein
MWNLMLVIGQRVEVDYVAAAPITASAIFGVAMIEFNMTAAIQ